MQLIIHSLKLVWKAKNIIFGLPLYLIIHYKYFVTFGKRFSTFVFATYARCIYTGLLYYSRGEIHANRQRREVLVTLQLITLRNASIRRDVIITQTNKFAYLTFNNSYRVGAAAVSKQVTKHRYNQIVSSHY